MKNEKKRRIKRKYFIFGIIALILILVTVFFGTRAYLYFNYLIGNDFVIILNADNSHFFLTHNQQATITLDSEIVVNPFCNSECSSIFTNLDTGKIIDEKEFNLKPTINYAQEYTLVANEEGKGQNLYRYQIRCKSIKTAFCQTSGEEKTKDLLITVDYDLNTDEKLIKNQSMENISNVLESLDYMQKNIEELNKTHLILVENLSAENFSADLSNISKSINILNKTYLNLKNLWEQGEFFVLKENLFDSEKEFQNLSLEFSLINESIYNQTLENNYLSDNFSYAKNKLEILKSENVSYNETLEINSFINEFNFVTADKSNYSLIYGLVQKINSFVVSGQTCCFASSSVNNFSLSKIYLNNVNSSLSLNFSEPKSKCCFLGNCSVCYEYQENKSLDYPIVFVHGHSFNHKVSAEYSFDTFEKMQNYLEKDGFINAGTIISTSDESKNVFGRANYPFSFRASYYFDIYKNNSGVKIIQTKQDSIDTYAIRLNDIIKEIKAETGKDKVIIICHSMGGLVSRRYLQIFGENDVDKLIIIGTPNHGIDSKIYDYCRLFGASKECDDMDSGSLLINKLDQSVLAIPVYNIIGLGCDMSGQNGDGIVENSSAYLSFAKNYYINGSCPGLNFLHLSMAQPNEHPEVYEIIKNALRE